MRVCEHEWMKEERKAGWGEGRMGVDEGRKGGRKGERDGNGGWAVIRSAGAGVGDWVGGDDGEGGE